MNIHSLPLLVHTVRHLRPIQIANRIQRKFFSAVPSEKLPPAPRVRSNNWTLPIERPTTLVASNKLRVFQHEIELTNGCWNDDDLTPLVRYNLHYFDDLTAKDASERREWHSELIARWIVENPPAQGVGWEPYPLSLRIVNWIKWLLAGNRLPQAQLNSLAFQARSLEKQLEFHLLGNHIWANAKALIFAGAFFSGPEADGWLHRGSRLLEREIAEQVLPDGGHFELSPMYHSILLEDLLDIVNLSREYGLRAIPGIEDTIKRMQGWLRVMCHPDGEISFFNDAAFGIASRPQEIDDFASRLGLPAATIPDQRVIHLVDSGYVRVKFPNHVMLIDVANAGASYQPGHSHADTLSFEWSLAGQRAFVNSGTSCYGTSAERVRQRGTAAHNTVIVDQQDSSEVWSGFRLARRAVPFGLSINETADRVTINCSHSGYRRLPERVTHTRKWLIQASTFSVSDLVSPKFATATSRLHFHPGWTVVESDSGVVAKSPSVSQAVEVKNNGPIRLIQGTHHPEFEVSMPNVVMECPLEQGVETTLRVCW